MTFILKTTVLSMLKKILVLFDVEIISWKTLPNITEDRKLIILRHLNVNLVKVLVQMLRLEENIRIFSFYKINKFWLDVLGQWPTEQRVSVLIRRYSMLAVSGFDILCHTYWLATSTNDIISLSTSGPLLIGSATVFLVGCYVGIYNDRLADLLTLMENDWYSEMNSAEIKIKQEYAKYAQIISKLLLYGVMIALIIFVGYFACSWKILDIIIPLNESRHPVLPFPTRYFFYKENDMFIHYLAFSIMSATTVYLFILGSAIESLFVVHMLHIVGMFDLIGYRLINAIPLEHKQMDQKNINKAYFQSLILCIQRHRKALEYSLGIEKLYQPIFIGSLTVSIFIFSPALYIVITPGVWEYTAVITSLVLVGFFFANTMIGQILIDMSGVLPDKAYFSPWIYVDPRIQKLLIILMRKSSKPCELTVYNLCSLSVDCFRMVMHTTISYVMVMRNFT
ncbi:putative odorant receptor 71a [Prorops nasuta]|uniref:putative odorant receptor 71a n=1 Tax=Prorops nasuta TaxID=863751 RepID=UPI0034CDF195